MSDQERIRNRIQEQFERSTRILEEQPAIKAEEEALSYYFKEDEILGTLSLDLVEPPPSSLNLSASIKTPTNFNQEDLRKIAAVFTDADFSHIEVKKTEVELHLGEMVAAVAGGKIMVIDNVSDKPVAQDIDPGLIISVAIGLGAAKFFESIAEEAGKSAWGKIKEKYGRLKNHLIEEKKLEKTEMEIPITPHISLILKPTEEGSSPLDSIEIRKI